MYVRYQRQMVSSSLGTLGVDKLNSDGNYVEHRMSLSYGHPYMIDVGDCDARLPSSDTPDDLYTVELVRLSILLGRVLKTIYR